MDGTKNSRNNSLVLLNCCSLFDKWMDLKSLRKKYLERCNDSQITSVSPKKRKSVVCSIFHFDLFLELWIPPIWSFHAFFYDEKSRIYCCAQTSRTKKTEEVHFHFWRRNMLVCRLQGASGRIDRRARPPERPPPSPTAATAAQMHDDELCGGGESALEDDG